MPTIPPLCINGGKPCFICKQWKSRENYRPHSQAKDGCVKICRECEATRPQPSHFVSGQKPWNADNGGYTHRVKRRAGIVPWNKDKVGVMPPPWNKGQKGRTPWNKGTQGVMPTPWLKGKNKPFSIETLKKMSAAKTGRKLTEEHKQKISDGNTGRRVPAELRAKMSVIRKAWCLDPNNRRKLSAGKLAANRARGIVPLPKNEKQLRVCHEYKIWRDTVFRRDAWTCRECGVKSDRLNAHHIKTWRNHPEQRFDVDNGITLCVPCHKKTPTYGHRKTPQN